jgi:hypothetical protein
MKYLLILSNEGMIIKQLWVVCIYIIFVNCAIANDKIISGKFTTQFFNNYNYDSTNNSDEFNENYLRSYLDLEANLGKNFHINSEFQIEEEYPASEKAQRSASIRGSDNRSFEDESLHIEQLNLSYEYKDATFVLGKFNANFGQSWNKQNNIWLFEEARRNYRQNEKIGVASFIEAGDLRKAGRYKLGFSTFMNDSKNLDGSTITKREGTNKNSGNEGDKRGLKSYVVSMDIDYDFGQRVTGAVNEKLSYHISYMDLAVNDRQSSIAKEKIQNVNSYALNMDYLYPIHKNIAIRGFVEYANASNVSGNIDKDEDFLTTIVDLRLFKNYNILLGSYLQRDQEVGTNGVDRYVRELSLGYKFDKDSTLKNFNIMAGIKREKTDYKTSKNVKNNAGFMLAYSIVF